MRRVFAAVVGLLGLISAMSGLAGAREATPAPAGTPGAGVRRERLVDEVEVLRDQYGRLPIVRVSFAPGAALPEGQMAGPLLAVVDAGTFEVRVGPTTAPAGPGQRLAAAAGEDVAARNTGSVPGAWLVVVVDANPATRLPRALTTANPTPLAPGVTAQVLDPDPDLFQSFTPVRLSIDRVVLAPGAALAPAALEGGMPLARAVVAVEAGAVAVEPARTGTPGEGAVLKAGELERFGAGDDAALVALGAEPAVLLVVLTTEVEEDDDD